MSARTTHTYIDRGHDEDVAVRRRQTDTKPAKTGGQVDPLTTLQRSAGNQALSHLLQQHAAQRRVLHEDGGAVPVQRKRTDAPPTRGRSAQPEKQEDGDLLAPARDRGARAAITTGGNLIIQPSLVDWLSGKLAQWRTHGKYDPAQRERGILMARAMEALKDFERALGNVDRALAAAEWLAEKHRLESAKTSLQGIRGKIESAKGVAKVVIDTEEKLEQLVKAVGLVEKLAEELPTTKELEDPATRDRFIDSCSAGLKLAAIPLGKLPPPMGDFARFFTDADIIIKGMARGFVMGKSQGKAAEKEAETTIVY